MLDGLGLVWDGLGSVLDGIGSVSDGLCLVSDIFLRGMRFFGIGATLCRHQEIIGLPYAWFFLANLGQSATLF